jgi:hypothetical protein
MIGWTALFLLCLTLGMGLTAEATGIRAVRHHFLSVIQLATSDAALAGYLIQRPAPPHHHERGTHARNYSDLPIFDLLFGTFHNPQDFATATGFYDGASGRIAEMLRFRDASVPR